MRRSISVLLSMFKRFYIAFRLFYFLLVIIVIVLVIGGMKFWEERDLNKTTQPQAQHIAPQPDEVKETKINPTAEKEEDEDDENEEEDSSLDQGSSWTLLKTALPSYYSEPAANTQKPSVALILTGLGLNKVWTEHVLTTVKKKVTLVFSPYSSNINEHILRASSLGYQALIALPMEPYGYPNPDPGPYTLLTDAKEADNIQKAKMILDKIPNGTGVIAEYGSKFTLSQVDLEPVLREIKNRGSIFVDPNSSLHSQVQKTCKAIDMTCIHVDLSLPISADIAEGDEFVKKIIQNAKENGIIVISIPAIPAFVDHLLAWIDSFENNGFNLVTIAGLQTQELSLGTPGINQGIYQGTTDANKQDSHKPR